EGKDLSNLMEENKERELSDERLLKLTEEAKEMGVARILITGGGEPFIRKSIVLQMMERIKQNNIFGNLNTNGTLLNGEEINRIVGMNWDLIMFSMDGPNAKVHDYLRGVSGTFEEATQNLIRFKKVKKEFNSKKPEIAFNTVITEKNYRYLPELFEYANDMDCNNLTLIPLLNPEEYRNLTIKNKGDLIDVLNSALNVAEKHSIHTNINEAKEHFLSTDKSKNDQKENLGMDEEKPEHFFNISCFEPFLNMVVKMDGEVTPCCMIDDGPNLNRKSLSEIWHGEYYNNLREEFRTFNVPSSCSKCILSKEKRNEELRKKLDDTNFK
ncbi:MAG: radical SAM protein, partial [Candidatus Aenigmatarchaeota archaeon]